MNLQTMEYLIAVAEEQSISRAAERLHITREFDSCIIRKVLTGRIKPAFFMSNF